MPSPSPRAVLPGDVARRGGEISGPFQLTRRAELLGGTGDRPGAPTDCGRNDGCTLCDDRGGDGAGGDGRRRRRTGWMLGDDLGGDGAGGDGRRRRRTGWTLGDGGDGDRGGTGIEVETKAETGLTEAAAAAMEMGTRRTGGGGTETEM